MKKPENFSTIRDLGGHIAWDTSDPIDVKINHPYVIDGMLISLIEYGESILRINFKEYKTTNNTILIIHTHSIIEILENPENRKVRAFVISPGMLEEQEVFSDYEIFFQFSKHPYIVVDECKMQELIYFHDFIRDQQKTVTESCQRELDKYLINALAIKIRSIYQEMNLVEIQVAKTNNEIMVDNFYKLLFEYYKEEREVSFYADKLCVSPKHLSFIVKQVLGRPIYHWITLMLIDNVKYQLKTTNLTIKEIADDFNFATPSVFGRFFKKHTGMTPVEYRDR